MSKERKSIIPQKIRTRLYKNMWEWINATLGEFRYCFSRPATYKWFVIVVVGLMLRSDHLGVTSIIRELNLSESSYMAMLHFFRSEGWHILRLQSAWLHILKVSPLAVKENGRYILTGDGVKEGKEGRKMPGVKRLHQESDNSSKGEYIHGHMFGGLGLLMGNGVKMYSVLISVMLHDGISAFGKWQQGDDYIEESHVVKMIQDAGRVVKTLGESILLLDRLFMTVPMLTELMKHPGLTVVTKAKSNATAYYPPGPYKGRGAKPKKGASVKVFDFFDTHSHEFIQTQMTLYGKSKNIRYFCINLRWGKKLYQELRFVLTEMDGVRSVLVSTGLTLSPVQIISLYCKRFKIECSFRELKQVVAGFSYHFWSKAMPKLQKFKSNDVNRANLENVAAQRDRKLIRNAAKAVEGFVQLSVIALGLLQLTGFLYGNEITGGGGRFMRTVSNETPSERTVADFLRKNIFVLFRFLPHLALTSIISSRQKLPFVAFKDSRIDFVA